MRCATVGGMVLGNGSPIGRRSFLAVLVATLLLAPAAVGQIYQWEYVDPSDPSKGKKQGTMFTPDGAMASLSDLADIYGKDHTKAYLPGSSFVAQKLEGTIFDEAYLAGADFRSLHTRGTWSGRYANFSGANFQTLFGVDLGSNTMDFWDLRGQDLRGSDLRGASMRGALLDLADLRSALMTPSSGSRDMPQPVDIPDVDVSRAIRNNGRLDLLRVDPGVVLTIRNAVDMNELPTPTNIQLGVAVFSGGGTLRFLLSEDPWKSTLVVPSNRPEYLLSDTLELGFDRDTDPYALLNKPIQLILWPRSHRLGEFNVVSDPKYTWDLSQLYSNGTVRLVGIVPEPATVATTLLLTAAAAGIVRRRRRQ